MNQNIKAYIKFGIFLLGILLLLPKCQQDDAIVPSEIVQEKRLKRISLDKLTSNIGNTASYRDLSAIFDVNKKHSATDQKELSTTSNVWINTNEIVMIQGEALTYYTFVLETNEIGNQFYNLVAAIDHQGTIQSMRILEYTPNEAWLTDTSEPFTGTLKLVQNTFFTTANIIDLLNSSSESTGGCVVGLSYEWECGAGYNHGPGHTECTPENNAVTQFIISPVYGPCPASFDPGVSGGGGGNNSNNDNNYPIDPNGNSGGGTSDDGTTPNPDGTPVNDEPCIVDANGNCLGDETTPMFPPREHNPCEELKSLTDMSATKIRLREIRDSESNFENALRVRKNPTTGARQTSPILNNINGTNHIRIPVDPYTEMIAHNHKQNIPNPTETRYEMFSGPDIYKLGQMVGKVRSLTTANANPVNILNITSIVVVRNGPTFALRIDDVETAEKLREIFDDIDKRQDFYEKLTDKYDRDRGPAPLYESTTTKGKQQRHIYDLLAEEGLNLTMFEATYDGSNFITGWQKINKDDLNREPCNE